MILVEVRMYNALVINVKFRILENNLNIVYINKNWEMILKQVTVLFSVGFDSDSNVGWPYYSRGVSSWKQELAASVWHPKFWRITNARRRNKLANFNDIS
jgi:hypothetical protein